MDRSPALLLIVLLIPNGGISSDVKRIEAVDTQEKHDEPDDIFPSCDLTENSCDLNCCSDKDCSHWERSSFNCDANEEKVPKKIQELSERECESGETDPIMCLHHSNSPYLGRFYLEPQAEDISEELKAPQFSPQQVDQPQPFVPIKKLSYHVPTNVLGKSGFCLPRPIKVPFNSKSSCLYTITEGTCLSNQLLRVNNYVSFESFSEYENLNNFTLVPEVKCLNNGSNYISLSRNIFKNRIIHRSGLEVPCRARPETTLNPIKHTCNNVVVGLEYTFDLKQSILSSGKLTILTTDIPISLDSLARTINQSYIPFSDHDQPFLYVHQQVNIHFNGVSTPFSKNGYKFQQSLKLIN